MNEIRRKHLYPFEPGTSTVDGFAGHFIAQMHCRFKLHHHVLSKSGDRYRVSTVGMMPDDDDQWHIFGGWSGDEEENKCETMVFKEELDEQGYANVPEYHEIDTEYSFDASSATIVHHDMVRKYEGM